jgi:GNAT superfamily N-acetyltransferase
MMPAMASALPVGERLTAHLRAWLGAWPPSPDRWLTVATSPLRTAPGWDGVVRRFVGVATPEGAVLSVPPDSIEAYSGLAASLDDLRTAEPRLQEGVFRWSESPADLDDAGVWIAVDDPRVPDWLKPFGGEVLMALDPDTGAYLAGVGIKRHDPYGHELAVVTEEAARGRGLARGLVAQAGRKVIADGAVPTYLHADANIRSAKVADAAGFPDRGWRILGISGS